MIYPNSKTIARSARPVRQRRTARHPQGHELHREARRGARHHGAATVRARARSPRCWRAIPPYEVTGGTVLFEGKNLLELAPEERARAGLFLGFQYPIEIPGVGNSQFLRLAYNTVQAQRGKDELDPLEFDDFVREKMKLLEMSEDFLDRSVNEGFSGGEKKRNEILQMALLEPSLAILDETDSGLDIDALRVVASGVNQLANKDNAIVLVTHYQRLLNYIVPDYVHVMEAGRIIKTGGKELALELEARGYDWVSDEYKAASRVAA